MGGPSLSRESQSEASIRGVRSRAVTNWLSRVSHFPSEDRLGSRRAPAGSPPKSWSLRLQVACGVARRELDGAESHGFSGQRQ